MSARGRDDSTGMLWTEPGESRRGLVATVAPVLPVEREYTFAVPEEFESRLQPGQRVVVPLGRKGRAAPAFCLSIQPGELRSSKEWSSTLRPIASLLDPVSFLDERLLELGRWIARHYACPLGRTLAALVPAAVRQQRGFRRVRWVRLAMPMEQIVADHPRLGPRQRALLERLAAVRGGESAQPVGSAVWTIVGRGGGSQEERSAQRTLPNTGEEVRSAAEAGFVDADELLADGTASPAVLREAVKRGWVELTEERAAKSAPDFDRPCVEPTFKLGAEQRAALEQVHGLIEKGGFGVGLLFGVSGSGKTEVYIRAMQQVVAAGRQAMLLVPEIALTTQLVNRLACRFRDVAVVHSGLSDVDRSLIWNEIRDDRCHVVIGTRSAVLAPCRELGLIVVDEEQETSYKNLRAPRFHVRDVAIKRGQLEGIPVLLGSATPSLETWVNCERVGSAVRTSCLDRGWAEAGPHGGPYSLMELPSRVRDLPMPEVQVVDMREEYAVQGRGVLFSRLMDQGLEEAMARGEQAVILVNRRGFASALFCPVCKRRVECPACNAAMVFHAAENVVLCHYCHRREPAPNVCADPSCGAGLAQVGVGTQRVEQHLRRRFGGKQIARADSDTMHKAESYQRLIDDFEARRIDVLVGTQMVAKGLDFPHVSFVGVVGGDATAAAADFRAGERLFQLIAQVAGRAGRECGRGRVVVQTLNPESAALQAAVRHDYRALAATELPLRRRFRYPPYSRLARVVLAHPRDEQVRNEAVVLAERLNQSAAAVPGCEVWGPQPCVITRLRGMYRHELLLRSDSAARLQEWLDHLRAERLLKARVKSLIVDVDPVDLA